MDEPRAFEVHGRPHSIARPHAPGVAALRCHRRRLLLVIASEAPGSRDPSRNRAAIAQSCRLGQAGSGRQTRRATASIPATLSTPQPFVAPAPHAWDAPVSSRSILPSAPPPHPISVLSRTTRPTPHHTNAEIKTSRKSTIQRFSCLLFYVAPRYRIGLRYQMDLDGARVVPRQRHLRIHGRSHCDHHSNRRAERIDSSKPDHGSPAFRFTDNRSLSGSRVTRQGVEDCNPRAAIKRSESGHEWVLAGRESPLPAFGTADSSRVVPAVSAGTPVPYLHILWPGIIIEAREPTLSAFHFRDFSKTFTIAQKPQPEGKNRWTITSLAWG